MAQIVQYPISNIQYPISNQLLKPSFINFLLLFKFSRLFPSLFCFFSILFIHLFLSACAPISDTGKDPAPESTNISFSVTAVASSVELEVSSIPAVTDVGAVIRLAEGAVPTKAEARASKGYVSLGIEADSTRKFSISQHYGSNFEDGFTLADVLSPNTSYKLYLFMPSVIDLGQIKIKGGKIEGDRVEISFTTASLPADGDVLWGEKFAAKEHVTSLGQYHFMESQTGVIVLYFQSPYRPFSHDLTIEVEGESSSSFQAVGRYSGSGMTVAPLTNFYFNTGLVAGYPSTTTSQTFYMIAADNGTSILRGLLKSSTTPPAGTSYNVTNPISRY
ncbi:hypothetical protein P0082_00540 [Candidatus Haliotispira prima]|uniref:DUF4382 domain-containing protein n=1 Tax=Candidatus Haliotispira prima TaxID=3034016 RepID=A0ABY8MH79_9SPIO|nr:hypothetical protein P0082_00540 [Candidatus Haliotispira prima]